MPNVFLKRSTKDKADVKNLEIYADLAHLVERDLAKVEVAGSNPVIRSIFLSCVLYFLSSPEVPKRNSGEDVLFSGVSVHLIPASARNFLSD